jgi:hypothetical protein
MNDFCRTLVSSCESTTVGDQFQQKITGTSAGLRRFKQTYTGFYVELTLSAKDIFLIGKKRVLITFP